LLFELRVLRTLLLVIAAALSIRLFPTSALLDVEEFRVFSDGIALFDREPLFDNLKFDTTTDFVRKDGVKCRPEEGSFLAQHSDTPIIVSLPSDVVDSFCFEEGGTYTVRVSFWIFRPLFLEATIEPPNPLFQNINDT